MILSGRNRREGRTKKLGERNTHLCCGKGALYEHENLDHSPSVPFQLDIIERTSLMSAVLAESSKLVEEDEIPTQPVRREKPWTVTSERGPLDRETENAVRGDVRTNDSKMMRSGVLPSRPWV
jgi:hypothetical protein